MEEKICTCYDGRWKCDRPALYRYQGIPNGEWFYLCFDHWGMTCIARIAEPDAIFSTSLEKISELVTEQE